MPDFLTLQSNDAYDERTATLATTNITPKREPNLIRRIANLIFRADPGTGPQPDQQRTTESGIQAQALQSVYDQYFRSQNDRLAIYKDCDEMDNVAEEVSVALDTITNNVTSSEDGQQTSFEVLCEDAGAKKVLDDVTDTCHLHKKIRPWTRNTIKYGDSFTEIVVNAKGQVVDCKQLPPATMWRNVDVRGNLIIGEPKYDPTSGKCLNLTRECAFEQRAEDTQTVVATFWPWQIVHLRLNHDGYRAYGRSLLRVTRVIWKKLKAMEEALIIARLTRAWPQKRYFIDTTGMSGPAKRQALKTFSDSVSNRYNVDNARENPAWVGSDIFIADNYDRFGNETKESRTRIEDYDPKMTGLGQMGDYDYLHRKLLATVIVPPAYLGFEKEVNSKATVTNQDAQYIRKIRDLQQLMGHGLEQVYDTALILAGYDPQEVEYEIKWPVTSAADEVAGAQSEYWRSQADQIYAGMDVIDTEWMQRSRYGLQDEEIDEINERLEKSALEEQAQQEADQEKFQQMQVKAQKYAVKNGNGNGPPSPVPSAMEPGGRTVRQELSTELMAEAIRSRAMNLIGPDLTKVLSSQNEALIQARSLTLQRKDGLEVRSDQPVNVNLTIAEGAVQSHNTIVPPTVNIPPTQVTVEAPTYPEPKTPVVNVSPPQVNVSPTFKAPDVNVTVQQPPPGDVEVVRDQSGAVKEIKRKPNKGN